MAQWLRLSIALCLAGLVSTSLLAQVRQQGPPPEIRELIDGVVAAINGDAAAWEAFAQAKFAPAYLKSQTPQQRADAHAQMVDRFGTVARGGVMRDGPDAPLQITVKGSKANGVVIVDVDDTVFKIRSIGVGSAAPDRAAASGLPPVPVDASMASDEIDRRLNDYFSKLAADDVFSGAAIVARNGTPVFMR